MPKGGISIALTEGRRARRTRRTKMVQRANARKAAKNVGSHESTDTGASPSEEEGEETEENSSAVVQPYPLVQTLRPRFCGTHLWPPMVPIALPPLVLVLVGTTIDLTGLTDLTTHFPNSRAINAHPTLSQPCGRISQNVALQSLRYSLWAFWQSLRKNVALEVEIRPPPGVPTQRHRAGAHSS